MLSKCLIIMKLLTFAVMINDHMIEMMWWWILKFFFWFMYHCIFIDRMHGSILLPGGTFVCILDKLGCVIRVFCCTYQCDWCIGPLHDMYQRREGDKHGFTHINKLEQRHPQVRWWLILQSYSFCICGDTMWTYIMSWLFSKIIIIDSI